MKLQPAHYTLAGSAITFALTTCVPTLRQWERVQQVALGVFAISAIALTCTPTRSKEKTIADLAKVTNGSLDELSDFAYDTNEQFLNDWPRDKPGGIDLNDYTNEQLIKTFFHQGIANAAVGDLQNRFETKRWGFLGFGILPEGAECKIKEDNKNLTITYIRTLRLFEGENEYFRRTLTSTLTVEILSKSATSFVYTLEPLDETE